MTDAPKQASRLETVFNTLWGDKTPLGASVRRKAKELFPDIEIPDEATDAAVAPIKAEMDELKKQNQALIDKIAAKEKADADLQSENALSVKIQQARQEFGLTDAGFEKMLARMKETGNVADPQAAAAWVVSQMPKPEPQQSPSWLPEPANLFGSQKKDERFEALHRDPRKYLDDELREFARDPDRYTAETFGQN